jgi:hypothetical protein
MSYGRGQGSLAHSVSPCPNSSFVGSSVSGLRLLPLRSKNHRGRVVMLNGSHPQAFRYGEPLLLLKDLVVVSKSSGILSSSSSRLRLITLKSHADYWREALLIRPPCPLAMVVVKER